MMRLLLARVDARTRLTRFLERSVGVIVMYHAIDSPQGYAGRPPVTFDALTRHLALLGERYTFTSLQQLADGRTSSRKCVVLTFDDGHRSFLERALPLLMERAVPATAFVCSGLLGKEQYLSREEVRDLSRMPGIEIGNHTRTHVDLRAETSEAALEREVVGGKNDLEDLIGSPVTSFSYPYGRLSRASMDLVRRTHTRAVTVLPGVIWPDADPLTLPRVGATGTSLSRFAFDLTDVGQLHSWSLRYDPDGRVRRHVPARKMVVS